MTDLESAPEVLIDPNKLSEDGTLSLARIQVSPNAKYIAYAVSEKGSDWTEIHIKNIESGKTLSDKISGVKFSNIAWLPNETASITAAILKMLMENTTTQSPLVFTFTAWAALKVMTN